MMSRVIMIIIGMTIGGLACVWNNLQVRALQYDITETKKELRRARRSYKQVRVEFEKLRSPSRLQDLREEEQLNFVSRKRARAQQLTPQQMREVIRKQKLAGTNDMDVRLPVEEGQ